MTTPPQRAQEGETGFPAAVDVQLARMEDALLRWRRKATERGEVALPDPEELLEEIRDLARAAFGVER